MVQFLCSCREPFLRPGLPILYCDARRRGQGRPAGPLVLALTAPSTARTSRGPGRQLIAPPHLEVAPSSQDCPSNPGELVSERNCQHVVVQTLLGGFNPALEAVPLPVLQSDQHDPSC